jgi:phytoene dehydrogenase-like protein
MLKANKDSYDAIIIGAGISGLVCGCYLAKAGMKVLIAEQHFKPGGYCTSFKRKEFTFDAAAHSIGGLTMYGNLAKIFEELGIDQKIKIKKYDPRIL